MPANEELAGQLRRIIPTKSSLASDLALAIVGLGLGYICHFVLTGMLLAYALFAFGMGIAGLTRFVERLRFRKDLNRILKESDDRRE